MCMYGGDVFRERSGHVRLYGGSSVKNATEVGSIFRPVRVLVSFFPLDPMGGYLEVSTCKIQVTPLSQVPRR